jgi:hypothetical protein
VEALQFPNIYIANSQRNGILGGIIIVFKFKIYDPSLHLQRTEFIIVYFYQYKGFLIRDLA